MLLNHRLIEVFRAVMQTGNLTRAAERLHTSQPTVSRELARLEQVLGMRLFERVRGRLQPSTQAQALFAEVQRSYLGLERVAATAAALRQFAQGHLALACLPALAHGLLPAACADFRARHAEASLSITPQESPLLEEWLSTQRFDLGLIEHAEALPNTEASELFVGDEVAVLPVGHPLLARACLEPADFAAQDFISLAPQDPYRQALDAMFAAQGVVRRLVIETTSAASVCALVRQGLGIAIINPLTALELEGLGLAWRPLSVAIAFRVTLIRPLSRGASPLADAFVRSLQVAAAGLKGRRPAV